MMYLAQKTLLLLAASATVLAGLVAKRDIFENCTSVEQRVPW
jgi:hypothetical protein